MGSILHIASQFDTERTHLHPRAVFGKIRRGEPVPVGEPGERRWALSHAITIVQGEERDDGADYSIGALVTSGADATSSGSSPADQ
jgi:hypothetical protein